MCHTDCAKALINKCCHSNSCYVVHPHPIVVDVVGLQNTRPLLCLVGEEKSREEMQEDDDPGNLDLHTQLPVSEKREISIMTILNVGILKSLIQITLFNECYVAQNSHYPWGWLISEYLLICNTHLMTYSPNHIGKSSAQHSIH